MASNPPSERVHVSGLPEDLNENKLKSILGEYGTLKEVKLLGKGACILKLADVDEATWLVENLDGNMPEGLKDPVAVKFANPIGGPGMADNRYNPYGGAKAAGVGMGTPMGTPMGGAAMGPPPGSIAMLKQGVNMASQRGFVPDNQQIFIRNLPADTADADLYEIFSRFGAIAPKGVRALLNPDGSCKGTAFVDYTSPEAAQAALALNGVMLPGGMYVNVRIKTANRPGQPAMNPAKAAVPAKPATPAKAPGTSMALVKR